jgi:protein arginine kinase activator
MLCDRCKKREAKILYTEIIDGIKKEQHLCEECAAGYTSFQIEKPYLNTDLTLGDLLSTLLDNATSAEENRTGKRISGNVCSACGTSYEEFLQKGRFGCSQCYQSFSKQLDKTLKEIHGADRHTGKHPKGYVTSTGRIIKDLSETEKLSLKLQEAVENEEFEEAARLRDQIRKLKKEEVRNA